jgi:NhaP-type Na+/H+ or K+/H+ antiporter
MTTWFIVIGLVLCTMALLGSLVDRLPLSSGLIYLVIGYVLGPAVTNKLVVNPVKDASLLEVLFLVAVLISLFTVGLKLRTPGRGVGDRFSRSLWILPVRLAGPAMVITIALVAVFTHVAFGLGWGAALLIGAMLAPTDPVLASDVQVHHENDRDSVRFGLSAEGGLNDATASPFVLLGLGVLGLHELGTGGWQWLAVDVLWSVVAGFTIGWLSGLAFGAIVLLMRKRFSGTYGFEEFLALGLIALSYGLADAAHALGFLSVLAAGLAMRRIETRARTDPGSQTAIEASDEGDAAKREAVKRDAVKRDAMKRESPTRMVGEVLDFNQRFESIGEVAAVLLLGAMLSAGNYTIEGVFLGIVLFGVIRPLSVWLSTLGASASARHKRLLGWFGVRGVGTLYYLVFAIDHGLPDAISARLVPIVLTTVALSIVVHGISATPLMRTHERRARRARDLQEAD